MKFLLASLLLVASFSASATPVFLQPTCSTYNGECTLFNTSGKDVNCTINVSGMTKNGRMISGVEFRMLYSGMFAWIRVSTYDINDPIASLSAYASCNTIRD